METEGALLAGRHAFSGADQDTTLWRLQSAPTTSCDKALRPVVEAEEFCWWRAMHSLGDDQGLMSRLHADCPEDESQRSLLRVRTSCRRDVVLSRRLARFLWRLHADCPEDESQWSLLRLTESCGRDVVL